MIILKSKGIFSENGRIILDSRKDILWQDLSEKTAPKLPEGTSVELSISFDENIFLKGINGIVWATYDPRQAEVIQNTLLVQNIESEVNRIEIDSDNLITIKILNTKDINPVIEFIWKSESGLRLKPDWVYPAGEINKSFELWLSGH